MAIIGAKVAIWERDPQTCAATAADLGALGIVTDARGRAGRRRPGADGRGTRAGEHPGEQRRRVFASPLLDTAENGWDALYRANLRHVLLCTQRVARQLVADGRGGSVIR